MKPVTQLMLHALENHLPYLIRIMFEQESFIFFYQCGYLFIAEAIEGRS